MRAGFLFPKLHINFMVFGDGDFLEEFVEGGVDAGGWGLADVGGEGGEGLLGGGDVLLEGEVTGAGNFR